ncbi:MAG: hypothetical protein AVDCRST_MAG79-335, partial [uncultured Thermoleophilia bacterium]
ARPPGAIRPWPPPAAASAARTRGVGRRRAARVRDARRPAPPDGPPRARLHRASGLRPGARRPLPDDAVLASGTSGRVRASRPRRRPHARRPLRAARLPTVRSAGVGLL